MKAKKLLVGLAVVVPLALLVAAGALYFWLRSGRPARRGEHSLPGLASEVTVRWDRWGVPAIRADSEADLAAALGWIHANDRFTQMELGRRAVAGRLGELLGEPVYEIDVYFRTHRTGRLARKLWEGAGPRSRLWLASYAAGVNAWLAERGAGLPPELRLLDARPEPWEGVHSLAFALLMARDLSFWDDRPEEERFLWLRAFGADAVADLLGDPDLHVPEEILALARDGGLPEPADDPGEGPDLASPGSNSWAVGRSRTAAGHALVANDPHLGLGLPSVWYQVHLRAPGFAAAGMTLPGAPGVVLGRGTHVAWAFTNTMLDDHDVFFEILDETGERYRRGDEWLPLTVEEETIRLRGGESRTVELRATDRGPLLPADDELGLPPRSLAWTAFEAGDPVAALLALAEAETVDGVLAAIEPFTCPAQNVVAALDSGEILFTVIGRVPERRRGDGRLPSPGWDLRYGWDGLRPREENPTVLRPADDVLVTANHDIRPPGYALSLVSEFFPGHRAERIRERLTEESDWDWELVGKLQTDVVSLYARDLLAAVEGSYTGDAGEAWRVLAGWDHAMTARGPSALYALVQRELLEIFADEAARAGLEDFATRGMLLRLLRGEMDPRWFDDVATEPVETRQEVLAAALATAWREGRERWGGAVGRWDYGEIHRLTLRHPLDAVPLLGRWLRRGPYELPGSATTVAAFGARWRGEAMEVTYGPSMRWIVDWGQPDKAFAMLPGGQSGHAADPHYDDQVGPFLAGRLRPTPWTEEQIESTAVTRLRLVPE